MSSQEDNGSDKSKERKLCTNEQLNDHIDDITAVNDMETTAETTDCIAKTKSHCPLPGHVEYIPASSIINNELLNRTSDNSRKRKYTKEQLIDAVVAVKNKKMSLTEAAKAFSVPRSTLGDHVRGRVENYKKPGIPSMLTDEEEEDLVQYILSMAKYNMPLMRKDIRETIMDILSKGDPERLMTCRFNLEKGPSNGWLHRFYEKHKELKSLDDNQRKSRSWEYVLDHFFNIYETVLTSLKLRDKPEQIFNCSEIGIDGHTTPLDKPCAIHDEINCQLKLANDDHMSAFMTVSASGQVLPTMVLAQKSIQSERVEVPELWSYRESSKGSMDKDLFRQWFSEIFLKNCGSDRPVILLLGKHMCHISIDVLQTAIASEIHILGLPTNTANLIHHIQPLDVEVFNVIKENYNEICVKTGLVPGKNIVRSSFPLVWESAIEQSCCMKVIPVTFHRTGLYPLDPSAVCKSKTKQLQNSQKSKALNTVAVSALNEGNNLLSSEETSTSKVQESGSGSEVS